MTEVVQNTWIENLAKLNPCKEAMEWSQVHPDPQEAWNSCKRGDWMLWILGHLSGRPGTKARKKLVLCTCEFARLSLKYVKSGEIRPLKSIETAEKYARNEGPTIKEVRAAADAAYDAAYAAADTDAAAAAHYAAAAHAAATAADAAADAAYIAAHVAYAAAVAAAADAAADAQAARKETLKKCANIVRKHYSTTPVKELERKVK